MDLTIFNRRTLLGGGALVGLGALLAACGQQANNEAAATATAAPSETASASAAASESPSASATPSTVRGYSGGSKAPDGEYRKADAKGPAQNVPKPPERKQYPETFEGLANMMTDWVKARNYGIQTGDMHYARAYVEDTFKIGINFFDFIEDLYRQGGWVVEGLSDYQAESDLMYDEKTKKYSVLTKRIWTYGMYINPDGSWEEKENTYHKDETFMFHYKYLNGYWSLIGYVSNQELREQGVIK